MLAPSVERATGPAHDFAVAARDRYPAYVAFLADRTGIQVPLNRSGILQVALSAKGIKGLKKTALPTARWLDAGELQELEPALSHAVGAMFNPDDGAVDNTILVNALETFASRSSLIAMIDDAVVGIDAAKSSASVTTRSGNRIRCGARHPGRRSMGGPDPRRGARARGRARRADSSYLTRQLQCATWPTGREATSCLAVTRRSEAARWKTSPSTRIRLRRASRKFDRRRRRFVPRLASGGIARSWAGLRPMTADTLPLIGADPRHESLIYACGHGRNGVLMAPLTGDLIADLVTGTPLSHDLSQFRPDRF